MTFLIYSQHSAVVKISLVMWSTAISVMMFNTITLGTEFTLMALGGMWMLPLIAFKHKNKVAFTIFAILKMPIH